MGTMKLRMKLVCEMRGGEVAEGRRREAKKLGGWRLFGSEASLADWLPSAGFLSPGEIKA